MASSCSPFALVPTVGWRSCPDCRVERGPCPHSCPPALHALVMLAPLAPRGPRPSFSRPEHASCVRLSVLCSARPLFVPCWLPLPPPPQPSARGHSPTLFGRPHLWACLFLLMFSPYLCACLLLPCGPEHAPGLLVHTPRPEHAINCSSLVGLRSSLPQPEHASNCSPLPSAVVPFVACLPLLYGPSAPPTCSPALLGLSTHSTARPPVWSCPLCGLSFVPFPFLCCFVSLFFLSDKESQVPFFSFVWLSPSLLFCFPPF